MNRLLAWLGPLVGLIGLIFVIWEIARDWPEISDVLGHVDGVAMTGALVIGIISLGLLGLVWKLCLSALGHRIAPLSAMHQYFVGQLGKYVPGGIWPVIGRAEMARRSGATGPTSYWATILAMGLTYLGAILWTLIAVLAGAPGGQGVRWQPVVALLPLGVLALHPTVLGMGLRVLRRVTGRKLDVEVPQWSHSIGILLAYLPAWLGITTSTWLVARGLGEQADPLNILFATTISWTIGFLVIPVPGGIGVREAAFVAAATSLGSGSIAAAVAVVARFVFISCDAVGAGLTGVLIRSTRRLEIGDGLSEDHSER